jgi:Cu-Zn family superoxide dismutase
VDPAYANPRNEVWLDLTADAAGAAAVTTRLTWTFDEVEPPRSLVLHAEHTRTAAGTAGMAGARVACLTLGPR